MNPYRPYGFSIVQARKIYDHLMAGIKRGKVGEGMRTTAKNRAKARGKGLTMVL